jgi:chromosome segregation ATPase
MTIDLAELADWRAETDAHLARLDLVTEEHGQDLQAKRGADNKTLSAVRMTQLDHGKKLDVIEVKLDRLGRGPEKLGRDTETAQADMGMVKGRLSKVEGTLREHTATLREHTTILKEHSTLLGQHSRQLAEIQTGVQTIIGLLDRGIDGNEAGDS